MASAVHPAAPAPASGVVTSVVRGRRDRGGRHAAPTNGSLRWAGPLGVLIVAALARFWSLGAPGTLNFDETYYVKDAWSLLHLGYEGMWPDKADAAFEAGHVNGFLTTPSYVAHPPLGKWIIGLGELAAGGAQNSAGWRLSVAVVGVLAVALLMVVAHRLFRNALVTTVAGGLFAIDTQAIVMSRVALLDNMVMFFALAAFACLIEDRFWVERRFGRWLMDRDGEAGGWGPTMLWRPWLLGVGLLAGLCTGVKWSGVYFLAAFVLYSIASDMMLRRRAGIRFWYSATLLKQSWATALVSVPVAVVAYLVCWTGWFATSGGYDRQGQYLQSGGHRFTGLLQWVPQPLQDLWAWHVSIYAFHIGLTSAHNYSAPAILWPLIARPTSIYWDGPSMAGGHGCRFGTCAAAITDIPNPLLWYAGIAATIYLIVRFVRRREWQGGIILLGYVGGYLPWLMYPKRTIFFFYSIAFEPYLILCLAATIGLMVVRAPAADLTDDAMSDEIVVAERSHGLRARRGIVTGLLAAVVLVSVFFYPLADGMQTPYWFWHIHMWSPTWI